MAAALHGVAFSARERLAWTHGTALPNLLRLAQAEEYDSAFRLATRLDSIIPGDGGLALLWPRVAGTVSIRTEPAGAMVYRRPFADDRDTTWLLLGTRPLDGVRFPWGMHRLRIEKDGSVTRNLIIPSWMLTPPIVLDRPGAPPDGMVRVTGWPVPKGGVWSVPDSFALHDFYLGRYEVTNEEYQRFVDSGGYARPDHWVEPSVEDGKAIGWQSAVSRFVDRTGRPGPGTWEVGHFPEGKGRHPVSGISWYEAAAFARFAGKRLPTAWHLQLAMPQWLADVVVPLSNIARSSSSAPVGQFQGVGPYGTFDQFGNVREWADNAQGTDRIAVGAAWDDPSYLAIVPIPLSPWNRAPENGMRLATGRWPGMSGSTTTTKRHSARGSSARSSSTPTPASGSVSQALRATSEWWPMSTCHGVAFPLVLRARRLRLRISGLRPGRRRGGRRFRRLLCRW